MGTGHTFDTLVVDKISGAAVRSVTIPTRFLPDPKAAHSPATVIHELGLFEHQLLQSADDATVALTAILVAGSESNLLPATIGPLPIPKVLWESSALELAKQIVNEPTIPFEQSPLDLKSLTDILRVAPGVGLGAYVGLVAFGPTPLLLVAVPAGIILVGAAKGVANALEMGLQVGILRLLGVRTAPNAPTTAAASAPSAPPGGA